MQPNVVHKPIQVLFLFFQGGADCWRPEWRDSHLGSEDRPQRAADPGARGLGQLRPHRPRCQLHGGSQQLGELSDTVLVELFYFFIVNLKLTEAALLFFLLALVLPGQLLRVEPCRRNWRGGDSDDPQDQDPCTQPLLPPLQV